jgi:hypothetical protein
MIPRRRHDEEPPERAAGPAGIVRRAFAHTPSPEQELQRVLEERQAQLEEYAARFEETARELERREQRLRDERASVERLLRRSTSELEAREKELVGFERELRAREERLAAAETDLARRRGDLGAVELKRAALERREQALESREAALAEREAAAPGPRPPELLFVPGPTYRLREVGPAPLEPGAAVDVEGEQYVVARIGRSPLPGDPRRCAYLERGAPRAEPGGSL